MLDDVVQYTEKAHTTVTAFSSYKMPTNERIGSLAKILNKLL